MHTPNLEIDLLRTFVAAADTGSFTAAGELVARTQSAVSIQIKRLEEVLGARIFERTSRSLALTRAGSTLLAYARRMLELNDESVRVLTHPPLEGEMRVGISEYFQPREITGMLARFAQVHPHAVLDVHIGLSRTLKAMLAQGELQLIIGRVELGERAAAFRREQLHWMCAHDKRFEPGARLPLVALPEGCILRDQAQQLLNKRKRPWRLALTVSGMNGLLPALEAGLGVAILPESMRTEHLRLMTRDEGLPNPGLQQLAFYERAAPPLLARAFRDVVADRLTVIDATRK